MNYFLALITCLLISSAHSTLNPKSKKSKKNSSEVKTNSGPVSLSVFERGFVDAEPQAVNIIQEANTYFQETGIKNFNGTVLGYVTPVCVIFFRI